MNQMILEMATVLATTFVDEDNKLHDKIAELEAELRFANLQIDSLQVGEYDYSERCIQQEDEIRFLRRLRGAQGLMIDKLHEETLELRAENNRLLAPLWYRLLKRVTEYVR